MTPERKAAIRVLDALDAAERRAQEAEAAAADLAGKLEQILEALPDDAPCKHPEVTGESLLDNIKDLVRDRRKWEVAEFQRQQAATFASTVAAENRDLADERDKLRAFAQAIMKDWYDSITKRLAIKYGLLAPIEVTEPCCEECTCAEAGDFPQICYQKTPLLTGKERE